MAQKNTKPVYAINVNEAPNEETRPRVRMNVSMNSKGYMQLEITAESPSPEESRRMLEDGLRQMRETVKNLGYQIADEQ